MLRCLERKLLLLLALAGLGVGSAVAEPLTKYTVTYGDAPAASAAPLLKTLKLAAAPQAIHTITFNVTGDEPFSIPVQDGNNAAVAIELPFGYTYVDCTVDGLNVEKDYWALVDKGIYVDIEEGVFEFIQVDESHTVMIECTLPKYVAETGDDLRGDGGRENPVRTIGRGIALIGGKPGCVVVDKGTYPPFACDNFAVNILAGGIDAWPVIDGGGTNRCATMGRSAGDQLVHLEGFVLRNGYAAANGGGALHGSLDRCIIEDCRADGAGGGVAFADMRNSFVSACRAADGNLVANSSLCGCTCRDNAPKGVSFASSGLRNSVVSCEGGATFESGCTFDHIVSNAVFASSYDWKEYRLAAGSPGLAGGDLNLVREDELDLEGKPRKTIAGGRMTVDCGCYENSGAPVPFCTVRGTFRGYNPFGTETFRLGVGCAIRLPPGIYKVLSASVDGVPVSPTPAPGDILVPSAREGLTFTAHCVAMRYADAKNGNDANDGLTPDTAKKTLQAAIDSAPHVTTEAADSVVYAAPGTYAPIATANRKLTIIGTEGAAKTIIDGGNTNRCANLGDERYECLTNTVLRGFTVQNGRCDKYGGGVWGGTVIACVIADNVVNDCGGGVAWSTVRESLITRNVNNYDGSAYGGGCYCGNYFNCTIVGNSAPNASGSSFSAGVYNADKLINCVVQENYGKDGVERNTYWIAREVATVTSGADFVDAARGDWHLARGSAGIGTGDLAYVMDATDLDGLNRTTTNAESKVTVNCGCYERVFPCLIHITYTGINPYGTNEFREVNGDGPPVPRGHAVTELTTNGVPVAKLPRINEPLVTGVRARTEVVVHFAAARYADAEHGDDANDGLSPDKAKRNLQVAIDISPVAASNAADSIVFAAPGTYAPIATENRWMTIFGTEGAAKTIIDGGGKSRCADLSGYDGIGRPDYIRPLESTNTVLAGFTVCNGYTYEKEAGAGDGAGVRGGTVVACVISGNTVYEGNGGGCYDSVLRESLIVGNRIEGPTIIPNGAAALSCLLYNCTVVSNTASMDKPELRDDMSYGICAGRAVNCIVQDNRSASGVELNVLRSWMLSTVTNGAVFADAANGDFHLKVGSAGIAAGDVSAVVEATDLDGAARLTTNAEGRVTVSCGCYERFAWAKIRLTYTGVDPYGTNVFAAVNGFGPEVPRGFAVTELAVNGEPAAKLPQVGEPLVSGVTTDTEVVVRFAATRYADAVNGDDANDGLSPDKAKQTLQAAIDIAPNGRTAEDSVVFAAPGVYAQIATANRKLMILGAEGATKTVIDGFGINRCADLGGEEFDNLTNTVLRGFTVQNGRCNKYGGGVRGGTVIACVIADNVVDDFGGGVAYSTVRESLITRNVNNCDGTAWGGGCCYGNYFNCTIVGNSAPNGSGSGFSAGVFNADNLINCVVQGNYGKNGVEQNTRDIYHMVATVTSGAVFGNAANGDYHLKPESAGVAAGDVAAVIDATDLEGAPRLTTDGAVTAAGAGKLPAGYVAAEYIESTPGGGQYIDTGYTPNKNTKVVFRMRDDGTGTYQSFGAAFGSRRGYLQERGMFLWLRCVDKNAPSYGRAGAEISLEKSDFPFGDMTTVTCLGRECSWRNDDGTKTGRINLASNYNYDENQEAGFAPLFIFAMNSPSTPGGRNPTDCWGFRLYSFQIYEGSDVKHDFVPCVSDTGKAGLYDTVGQKFHGNAGGGQFKVGGVTVNCGCYETLRRFRIHVTYTGVDPYGTNEFLDVEGKGPVVPRGYVVTELAVNGAPVVKLPQIGEPLVSGVMADTEVVVRFAAARYADAANGNDANDGLSPDKAKKTLQAAIDVAPEGRTAAESFVFVAPGTYAPIATANRMLTILGTEGAGETIIDGGNTSRCAYLAEPSTDDYIKLPTQTNTVLRGFTVCNGIVRNSDVVGAGVRGGTVIACVITRNMTDFQNGAGCAYSVVRESLITGNRITKTGNPGGSGAFCSLLYNSTVVSNGADRLYDPLYKRSFGVCYGRAVNCIVQGNVSDSGEEVNVYETELSYTVTNGAVFEDAANGDYHLKPESAGIAAGDVNYVMDATDLEGAARLTTNGLGQVTVNCGCYETVKWAKVRLTYTGVDPYGTNEFAAVGGFGPVVPRGYAVTELAVNGAPVAKLPQIGEPLVSGVMADTEVVVRFAVARYADEKNGDDANDGLSPDKAKKTLQTAIDIAPSAASGAADSIVFAAPGTYAPIATVNRMLTIVGTEGAAKTIIDGGGKSRCADLGGGEYDSLTNTVLRGFTVQNGRCDKYGGGVRGGTVIACVIADNVVDDFGGGVAYSTVRESLITRNVNNYDGTAYGGGCYYGNYFNCTIVGNSAPNGSGDYFDAGVYGARELVNCVVQGNYGKDGVERNTRNVIHTVATVMSGAVFADAANGDYHLKPGSAGIAAGDVSAVVEATDLEGAARLTTNGLGQVTVNCGCYETVKWAKIWLTYTGVVPYGVDVFTAVGGFGPIVPRGYAVTELAVNGEPVAKLPQVGEPLVSGITEDSEVVVRFIATRYADAANGDDANDGFSPDKAKKTLQKAIDLAPEALSNAADSVVFAAPGVYAPIATANHRMMIVGTGGASVTAIDAGGMGRCAELASSVFETSHPMSTNTVLVGFTVRNGKTISYSGPGVYCGTVIACVLSNNVAIAQNGAGCALSVVRETLITDNRILNQVSPSGAGAYKCWLYNCTVVANSTSNTDFPYGGTCGVGGGRAVNCIVQGNVSASGEVRDVGDDVDHAFTVTNGAKFVDVAAGDCHLKAGSAGIAAGDVTAVMDATDLEGAPRLTVDGGTVTVNCGCYETVKWAEIRLTYTGIDPYGTNAFTAVGGFGPLVPRGYAATELAVNGAPVEPLPQVGEPLVSGITEDAEVVVHFTAQRYADAANGDDANDGLSPDMAKKTLQAAIDVAPAAASNAADSVVFAAPGTYAPIATANRMLTIVGTGGAGETFIDGGGTNRCANLGGAPLSGGEYVSEGMCDTVLMGFTVHGGRPDDWTVNGGGGILGGTVIACVITGNRTAARGGAVCNSVVRNSLITDNLTTDPGGGDFCATCYRGNFYNCTVVSNRTESYSANWSACFLEPKALVNCIVQGNLNDRGAETYYYAYSKPVVPVCTITNGAVFADAANGDYHLAPGSAGIAAGNVGYVVDATDLEGAARLTTNTEGRVTVNCGCYETVKEPIRFVTVVDGGETNLIPYVWLETYGLAPRGSDYATHYTSATNASANPVGPGATAVFPAWKSYVAGLDPTNALEMFYSVITAPSNGWFRVGPNEVRQGRAYAVRETGVLRGAAVTNVWPIAEGQDAVDVEDNGTNSFFKVGVRVK